MRGEGPRWAGASPFELGRPGGNEELAGSHAADCLCCDPKGGESNACAWSWTTAGANHSPEVVYCSRPMNHGDEHRAGAVPFPCRHARLTEPREGWARCRRCAVWVPDR